MPMKFDPTIHHRQSIRLQGYDYTQAGAYFITIVTYQRAFLFGKIVGGEMLLNDYGQIVQKWWDDLSRHFPGVETGTFVVMPNHVHGIVIIHDRHRRGTVPVPETAVSETAVPVTGQGDPAPTDNDNDNDGNIWLVKKPTLGQIVAYFKYKSTKEMNSLGAADVITKYWQRNYYEHIIRNAEEHNRIHLYIASNPLRWAEDSENPGKK